MLYDKEKLESALAANTAYTANILYFLSDLVFFLLLEFLFWQLRCLLLWDLELG